MACKHCIILASLLLILYSISGCVQEKETAPEDVSTTQTEPIPKISTTTSTSTTSWYEEKYRRDGGMTRPSSSLPPVPEEFINKSRDYLITKYGRELFESSMKFQGASSVDFDGRGGCTQIIPIKSGTKYDISYTWDIREYDPSAPEDNEYRLDVIYLPSGEIYSTCRVTDCIEHPDYCPPYRINTREKALEEFDKACANKHNQKVSAEFIFYSNNSMDYTDSQLSEARFLWRFTGGEPSQPLWTVYMDPQTGKPLHDVYRICANAT